MTIWSPRLDTADAPRYQAIAEAIARDIERGVLQPGARLPTHRALAKQLGVTVGTVTRGYVEAGRRGLTTGEVGRGTYVRRRDNPEGFGWRSVRRGEQGCMLDLSLACPWRPPDGEDGRILAATLESIASSGEADALLAYEAEGGSPRQREIAAQWLGQQGVETTADRVVVSAGAQHAITVILSTLLRPGDVLLTEELTYPALKSVAQQLGIQVRGVAMDGEGVVPELLERAIVESGAKAMYCVPTMQNPTSRTMTAERREAIAALARRHGLHVLEDGVHVPLAGGGLPALAQFVPERTLYLATLSKWATFGLRTGFVAAPEPLVERLRSGVRSTMWMVPPLMVEIATRWLADGTAHRMGERKARELEARQGIVEDVLGCRFRVESHPRSLQVWLHLPAPWRSDECVAQAKQRCVLVAGAEAFAVGRRAVPHAVRIAIASPATREDVRTALITVADLLDDGPGPGSEVL